MSEILVVRHGETEWSKSGQHTSNTDLPLTEDGRKRAAPLRDVLGRREFALVLFSPLRRARETCEIAGLRRPGRDRREPARMELRRVRGPDHPQIREQNPDWDLWTDGCPGARSPTRSVRARTG